MNSNGLNALVTGANGFVGSFLAADLLEKGYRVRAMVRATSDLNALEGMDIEYTFADMTDPEKFPAVLEGVDIVFHVAGVTRTSDSTAFARVNAVGSGDLVRACRDMPDIKRFVYISSQAAVGPSRRDRPSLEDDPPNPIVTYGRSKLDGEIACREAAAGKTALTIVRPSIVYGPRDLQLLPLLKMAKRKMIPAILPNFCMSLIHAADLADLIEKAGRLKVAEGRLYNAADPTPYWTKQAIQTMGNVLGQRKLFIPAPPAALIPVALVNEILLKIGIGIKFLTRERLNEAVEQYWVMDISRAQEELGWFPKDTLAGRIRDTADWFIREGLL